MQISVKDARKHFYPNPTFELVYEEAVANALDAKATEVLICIALDEYAAPDSLKLEIRDNGIGFTDRNFSNFSKLLLSQDRTHRGLGRLVFLQYFKGVEVRSCFEVGKVKHFLFNDDFNGESPKIEKDQSAEKTFTQLVFKQCTSKQFKSYDNLRPKNIIRLLKSKFLQRFIELKRAHADFKIVVELHVKKPNPDQDFSSCSLTLSGADIPELTTITFETGVLDLLNQGFKMHYLVERCNPQDQSLATALCIDGRSMEVDALSASDVPAGTRAYFLLQSDCLDARVNDSRQDISLSPVEKRSVLSVFKEKISEVLKKALPEIPEHNKEIEKSLDDAYPHLAGYMETDSVGLIQKSEVVRRAQEKFMDDQREVLEATNLNDEQYLMSLAHASRILLEYILYRTKIIQKIAEQRSSSPECDIHNLIVPMQTESHGLNMYRDRYTNNAWLLDDKFMSYQYVLSDENIKKLIEKVAEPAEKASDDLRPDIAFVFSDDIEMCNHPVDVVVVELKKHDTDHLKTSIVIDQLLQRARRLWGCYGSRIQRMWFFGVVDFDNETLVKLQESWTPLYSIDTAFYKEEEVYPMDADGHINKENGKRPVSMTLWSYKAFIGDAKQRNETFLRILRGAIAEAVQNSHE